MRAAIVVGPGRIEVREAEICGPQEGHVIVDVLLCGICGTDVHAFQAGPGGMSPAVFGHEWVGRISALGDTAGGLVLGDRVVVSAGEPCGLCDPCAAGRGGLCSVVFDEIRGRDAAAPRWGGFAERITVHRRRVLVLPDEVADVDAAMIEPAAVAYRAIERAGLESGDVVVVQGAGPVGLLVVQIARARGAGRVVVVERVSERAELAECMGAHVVVARLEDVPSALGRDGRGGGADRVFECTGSAQAVQRAIGSVRRGGIVGLVGVPVGLTEVDIAEWIRREVTVTTSMGYGRADMEAVVDLVVRGEITMGPMHTGSVGLDELEKTLRNLGAGSPVHCKVLVDPHGTHSTELSESSVAR